MHMSRSTPRRPEVTPNSGRPFSWSGETGRWLVSLSLSLLLTGLAHYLILGRDLITRAEASTQIAAALPRDLDARLVHMELALARIEVRLSPQSIP
jgi:hypothetical protein